MSERKLRLVKPERAPVQCKTASEALALLAHGEIVESGEYWIQYKRVGDAFYVREAREALTPGEWTPCDALHSSKMPYDRFWAGK